MTYQRRKRSAVDGGKPLGIPLPALCVDGLSYWQAKSAWLRGEELSPEQLEFIGVRVTETEQQLDEFDVINRDLQALVRLDDEDGR